MLYDDMTFDEWAEEIDSLVVAAVPGVHVKHKLDDFRRWIREGKECHVYAISDAIAAFATLQRNGLTTHCLSSCRITITPESERVVASRIVGWLAPTS